MSSQSHFNPQSVPPSSHSSNHAHVAHRQWCHQLEVWLPSRHTVDTQTRTGDLKVYGAENSVGLVIDAEAALACIL
jgi:hypothetical protein